MTDIFLRVIFFLCAQYGWYVNIVNALDILAVHLLLLLLLVLVPSNFISKRIDLCPEWILFLLTRMRGC